MAAADTTRAPARPTAERPVRWAAVYAAAVAAAAVLAWATLRAGSTMDLAPSRGPASAPADNLAWRFLLVVALIAAVTLATGRLVERAGHPRVIGEILGGILLGPTALGAVAPGLSASLFTPEVLGVVQQLAILGVVLFMLRVGLDLDLGHLRRRGPLVLVVSHASIAAPFTLGLLLALVLYPRFGAGTVAFAPFALFLGLAMSVTALPVLAAILDARGLRRSPIGVVALACAAIDDVTAWCLLLVVIAFVSGRGASSVATTIAAVVAFVVVLLTAGRALLARATATQRCRDTAATLPGVLFVAVLLGAMATELLGVHAAFGALLVGAALPRTCAVHDAAARLEPVGALCLPLFFAVSGMRTDVGGLADEPSHLLLAGLVIVVAVVGKLGAATLAAHAMGLSWHVSASVGVLMNCRGLTELVVLNVGLDLGVIGQDTFSMLVLMTLVTTTMTAPLLGAIERYRASTAQ